MNSRRDDSSNKRTGSDVSISISSESQSEVRKSGEKETVSNLVGRGD